MDFVRYMLVFVPVFIITLWLIIRTALGEGWAARLDRAFFPRKEDEPPKL